MTPYVSTKPSFLFIDVRNGETALTSTISYEATPGKKIALWMKIDNGAWNELNLFSLVGTPDANQSGTFECPPLKPGQFLEIQMLSPDVTKGPDEASNGPLASATVVALMKESEAQLLNHSTSTVGGTFFEHSYFTGATPTRYFGAITRDTPQRDNNGRWNAPSTDISHVEGLSSMHQFEYAPLYSGTSYSLVVLLTTDRGEWQSFVVPLTTLRRQVVAGFSKIEIVNDGDPSSSGEAAFDFSIFEGDTKIYSYTLGDSDNQFSITDGQTITLSLFPPIIGPKATNPDNIRIGVRVSGQEFDGWFASDEFAANALGDDEPLGIPWGRAAENVASATQVFHGTPTTVDSKFEFKTTVEYSVTYVP
jgi:hypothetical protein